MRNMIRRVARLEEAMGVPDVPDPITEFTNVFIAPDGTVVDTLVLKIPSRVERQRALAALRNPNVESTKAHAQTRSPADR